MYNSNMSVHSLIRKPLFLLYTVGILLLLMTGWLWWNRINTNPERVFWGMMEQSLATSGVTIQAERTNEEMQVRQTLKYSLGAANASHVITNIMQPGTVVTNEAIGTPTADYTRYTGIQTSQKAADGRDLDFSKVIGVWSKSDDGRNQLFSQSILGTALPLGGMVVPIGDLAPAKRDSLMRSILNDNAYQVAFDNVKKERQNGRLVYVYDVAIQAVAYAGIMKAFAASVGLHDLDQLDPNQYQGQPALKLQFSVDVRSRHLVKVALPDVGYQQSYGAYDVPVQIEVPKESISSAELQQRLSEL